MEELMAWEGFLDGLEIEEDVPKCPVKKNENVRGEEGWQMNEMDLLDDLWKIVADKKTEELEELYEKSITKSGFEENVPDESDFVIQTAITFRKMWNSKWHRLYGSFKDVTLIRAMKYTYDYAPPSAKPCDSLQIFSAKVMKVTGLRWPLHVFGMVAVRDAVDRNRNLLFYRTRDNCQTLNEKDPNLVLTGPTRTVVVTENDYVFFEIYLNMKGNTESEDKYLMYCTYPLPGFPCIPGDSAYNLNPFRCYSNHGMLEIKLGELRSSVEATIFVQVVDGSWPDGFHGHFAARTSSECQNIVLFDFGADKVPVDGDGYFNFSRQVVSVELEGSLQVSFMAWRDDKPVEACHGDNEVVNGEVWLKPERAGRSFAEFRLGSCIMKVLVAWSLVLPEPQPDVPDSLKDS